MKKRNNQKMNMYAAVLKTCKNQQSAWENIPGFAAAVDELENKLSELHDMHTKQDGALVGVSTARNAFRTDLAEHLFVISKALRVKGVLTHDAALDLRNKVNLTELKGMSVNRLLHRLAAVKEDLLVHGVSLADYGITASFLAETETLMAEASGRLIETRMAIIARKEITGAVKERIRGIDQLINRQLDAFILSFKISFPLFYNRYLNARLIIDHKYGTKNPPEVDDGNDI